MLTFVDRLVAVSAFVLLFFYFLSPLPVYRVVIKAAGEAGLTDLTSGWTF